jgi:hypothetical protein
MRRNSGKGKCNGNLRDPTGKEHEASRDRRASTPAHGRAEQAEEANQNEESTEAGPVR